MTKKTVREHMNLCSEIDMVGCNSQPDFEYLVTVLQDDANMIRDIQFPTYDILFIQFNKTVDPIRMAELVAGLRADEVGQARPTDLLTKDCAKNITKYIRFWWD